MAVSKRKPAAKKKAAKASSSKKARSARRAPASKKKPRASRKPNAAFMAPVTPSAALSEVVGSKPLPRTEVTKKLWAYIKKEGLQNQMNRVARDPYIGPSSNQPLERSLSRGTRKSLSKFRADINWG